MDNGTDWEQLQAAGSPLSYFDIRTQQWVTGNFESNTCATAVKFESGAAVANWEK